MVKVILDTDIGGDCDDAGALGLLNALADNEKCEILAVASCMPYFNSVKCIDVINRFYGRDNIPIGIANPDGLNKSQYWDTYATAVAQAFSSGTGDTAEDTVLLYRRILSNQPDKSVTFVMIGPEANFAGLLKSLPDDNSKLSGYELVKLKVKKVVAMAGKFEGDDAKTYSEYNINAEIPAAQYIAANCPVEMVYSPFDVGLNAVTGGNLKGENPIKLAYETHGSADGRCSWDPCTVYYAVLGCEDLFSESEKGNITVDNAGITSFTPDPKGLHSYLLNKASDEKISEELNKLIDQKPKKPSLTKYIL